jgi:hypothetical protein
MKKCLICVVAGLATIAGVATAGLSQAAGPIQSLDAAISPVKLDKRKLQSAQLTIDIRTGPNTGADLNQDQPPNASRTVVDFPKNLKINTKAVPRCKGTPDQLANTSVAQAIEICGKRSIISVPGKSSASVTVDQNPAVADPDQTSTIPVVLTAFNGSKPNTLIFHNRADAVNNTTVLNEKLKRSGDKHYGTKLISIIPPVLAGGVNDFKVTIRKGTIIKARCKQKRNPFRITSTFPELSPQTVSSTTETTCKQKRSRRK